MTTARPTKSARTHLNEMMAMMSRFEWDMAHRATREGRVPAEWRTVWEGRSARTEKVTVRVDADVVRFFRSMGAGYGPRMNTVLRAFMHARLAGLFEGEDLPKEYRERWMGKAKPQVAEMVAEIERLSAMVRSDAAAVTKRSGSGGPDR